MNATITINHELFLAAVERYPWRNVQPNSRGRLIASSPFGLRADNTPSFSVVIDTDAESFGCWNDLKRGRSGVGTWKPVEALQLPAQHYAAGSV